VYVTEKKGFIRENYRIEKEDTETDGGENIAVSLEFFQEHVRKPTGVICRKNVL